MSATIRLPSSVLPETVDVEGVSPNEGVTCMGIATRVSGSTYRCLARVAHALCLIEVRLTLDEAEEQLGLNEKYGYRISRLELD